MYYLAFSLILIVSLHEIAREKNNRTLFDIIYLLLTAMAVMRYGQGQDYFAYEFNYDTISFFGWEEAWKHTDPLYYMMTYWSVKAGFSFELFAMLVGFATMAMWYVFLVRECGKSILSLYAFYTVVFMIYVTSALRQGLALSFFLCFAWPYLKTGKNVPFIVFTLIASLFHASAVVYFVLLLFSRIQSKTNLYWWMGVSFFTMFVGAWFVARLLPGSIQSRLTFYSGQDSTFFFARLVRILYSIPFILMLRRTNDCETIRVCACYIALLFSYAILSFADTASGRVWGYNLPMVCLLLAYSEKEDSFGNMKRPMQLFSLALMCMLFFKNIDAFIYQGNYRNTHWYDFPYISLLNKEDAAAIQSDWRYFVE